MPKSDVREIAVANAEVPVELRRLDRHEWWRWATVITVTLLLTVGMLVVSLPSLTAKNFAEQRELLGLLGIILLYDFFAVYQQVLITRLRRELTKKIAMNATLEVLKPPSPDSEEGRNRMRSFERFHFDRRVSIKTQINGKEVIIQGRTSDISEGGLGAVIPEPLDRGERVIAEIAIDRDCKLAVPAIVRHRRGFHHGIEFVDLKPEEAEIIRRATAGAVRVVDIGREVAAALQK